MKNSLPFSPNARLALPLLLLTLASQSACAHENRSGAVEEPAYLVTNLRTSAQVTVENDADSAIVEVYSDNGIGDATVKLIKGTWPQAILMRFHLQGLEQLLFTYDETAAGLSVNTAHMVLQGVSSNGSAPEPIDEGSIYWMDVTFLDRKGDIVEAPVAGGVIEVRAPADYLAGEYDTFTISWIDFFR